MRKYLLLTLLLLVGVCAASSATRQEMEHARALAAKWGVRSQNSGSGYLDGTNPKNMDQVKASVKAHKNDNATLAKLSLSMPSEDEYQSWDNARMTSYWISQYNSAVPAGGDKEFCRSKLKAQLSGLPATVTKAPEKVEETPEAPAEETPAEEVSEAKTDTVTQVEETEGLATDIVDAAAADPEVEPLAAPGTNGERQAAEGSKELASGGSNVWVIVMLVVLVLVVLALVGYASNMMARNNRRNNAGNPRRSHDDTASQPDEPEAGEPQLAQTPREEPDAAPLRSVPAEAVAATAAPRRASHRPAPRITEPRIIYLSNANAEGVFLRADAQYNMGNSIFKLITSDGYSGTFSVIDDPNVYEMALMMPVDFLVNACSGRNLQLTQGARAIVTDSTGTAVFENGRWRVARKAQIHYTR